MVKQSFIVSLAVLLTLVVTNETATPLFLQAITSALATIPFTGGPMTTGLVGAKLAVGTKLLYYLGYFGKRAKPKPAAAVKPFPSSFGGSSLPGNLQPLPLPYMFSGGGFPASSSFQAASFQPSAMPSSVSSGLDPSQLFQVLTGYGVDPNLVMEAINSAGGMNPQKNPSFTQDFGMGFGMNEQFSGSPGFGMDSAFAAGSNPNFGISNGFGSNANIQSGQPFAQPDSEPLPENSNIQPSENEESSQGDSEDVESFFTFLKDMDENTCISRLVCDIGHSPGFLGDFSENIYSMVGSLNVQPSSRAYQYIDIMEKGKDGQCKEKFPECTDMAYEIVKNVAPSVSLPQNVDPEAINQL